MKQRDRAYKNAHSTHCPLQRAWHNALSSAVSNQHDNCWKTWVPALIMQNHSKPIGPPLRGWDWLSLPSTFNYFTADELKAQYVDTVNRRQPLTPSDLGSALQTPHFPAQNITPLNFQHTLNTRTAASIRELASKNMIHDAISQCMLKMIGPVILSHVTSICNCSYRNIV